MTPKELSDLLTQQADAVAKHLLPGGKRIGHEWCAGSIGGEAGKSLKVALSGMKAGRWCDFAESSLRGDLIDLWAAVRGLSIKDAMNESAAWLGVDLSPPTFHPKRERIFNRPNVADTHKAGPGVIEYLTRRGLTAETIAAFRIGQKGDVMLFPYFDDAGNLSLCKCRSLKEKRFWMTDKDCRPILFGWQAVKPSSRGVVITEGEIDAMTMRQYGFSALSVPLGGGDGAKQDWIEHEHDRLERFDDIYLMLDQDEQGNTAVAEIIDRLGLHRCKVVNLPHKDANECLMAGISVEEMWQIVAKAKTRDPQELKTVEDFRSEIIAALDPNQPQPGFLPPWSKNKDIRFRPAEVTIIAGSSSHGKSEAVGHFTVDAISQGQTACIASLEMLPKNWLRNVVRQTSGQEYPAPQYAHACMDWLSPKLYIFDAGAASAKTDRIIEVFSYARKRYGVSLFIIDNLSATDIAVDDYEGQRKLLVKLADFAKSHAVHVFVVAHVAKANDDQPPSKKDVKGSGALTDLADTVLTWWRNRKKEAVLRDSNSSQDDIDVFSKKPDVICTCVKQRATGKEPSIGLFFHAQSHRFLDYADSRIVEYVEFEREAKP